MEAKLQKCSPSVAQSFQKVASRRWPAGFSPPVGRQVGFGMAPKNLSDVWYQKSTALCFCRHHQQHHSTTPRPQSERFQLSDLAIRGHDDDITAAPDDTSDTAICGFPTNNVRRTHMVSLVARSASAEAEVRRAVVSQLKN